ncbi:MAG TPA: glycoside hydrolase family 2 TIM barrel-domain containing protein [bacterium]|nr:glycoside hydrolase family 2 TIM barrel-domain containing protein [bacterium]
MRFSCCCLLLPFILLFLSFSPRSAKAGEWQKAVPPLATRWFAEAGPEKARPEYPNPAMARESWMNLNGLWRYAIRPRGEQILAQALPGSGPAPMGWEGEILVPWPVESALSGVQRPVSPEQRLWYRRTFTVPAGWRKERVLLHFEAVDWQTQVWVNGIEVGYHEGGYDPFTFDITAALKYAGEEVITVAVWDPTDTGTQPRGKQVLKPGGIFYTACTGIWGTVWIEPVPATRIEELRIVPDAAAGAVTVTCRIAGAGSHERLAVTALEEARVVASGSGAADAALRLTIPGARLWSPASPHLYDLTVQLLRSGKVIDEVKSYFGLRTIAIGPDQAGVTRLLLNGEPLFQAGPLDQGFWPDGIYTAPTEEAMVYDLEVLKRMGFNMLRKHVKVEPRRFYWHCDRLGLLVWQDMPSGDRSISPQDDDIVRSTASASQYYLELERMITSHFNHPSIVMWVPFNEGWGQFESGKVVDFIRGLDPTRLVNQASGWTDRGGGDVVDWHRYPGPASPAPEALRAAVLGEFGGLGLKITGHMWTEENWGYQKMDDMAGLQKRYEQLWMQVWELQEKNGLSAAVYTQTTDVETEANGLMTYDREVIKQEITRAPLIHTGRLPALPLAR